MLPSLANADRPDGRDGNVMGLSNDPKSASIQSDGSNLCFGQSSFPVSLATVQPFWVPSGVMIISTTQAFGMQSNTRSIAPSSSSFPFSVSVVVGWSAEKEMLGVKAAGSVAVMAYAQPRRDWTIGKFPSHSRCSSELVEHTKESCPILEPAGSPVVASQRPSTPVNLGPKAFRHRHDILWSSHEHLRVRVVRDRREGCTSPGPVQSSMEPDVA